VFGSVLMSADTRWRGFGINSAHLTAPVCWSEQT